MLHISAKQVGSIKRRSMILAARRLLKCRRAATAVEFAIIAPVFSALLFADFDTALWFYAQQVIQTATTQSARLIMTGQAQAQGLTAAQFKQAVCANITGLLNCAGVSINVQRFSSFSTVAMLNPIQNGNFNNAMNFSPGAPGDIILVQLFYQWPIGPALLGVSLANVGGTNRLLIGTAAFRNEPYH
jgi:Flp pilus assembly protein TadG